VYPYEFLVENCPDARKLDIDYILSLMDWPKNVDPHYKKTYFRPPVPVETGTKDFSEGWVSYANDYICAKELTVEPGRSVTVKDCAAYGCIVVQGHGKFDSYDTEAAIMLRFGQLSADEFFVGEAAAKKGVRIVNESRCEPLVILKHFGPNNTEMPKAVPRWWA
jgi:hypothetical protein